MNWFLIALVNPLAHAIANHFDKYLISRFVKDGSVGTLILFSALFAVFALPVIWLISPGVLASVSLLSAVILMVNGAILVGAIIFYLYALQLDEASYVAPLFQFIPIFGLIIGYAVLGEQVTLVQFLAMAIILAGASLLSVSLADGKIAFKGKVLALMVASSLLYAANAVVFKYVALDLGFMDSLFWDMTGKFLFGVLLFVFIRSYRREFMELMAQSRFLVLGLNSVNEVIGIIGEVALVLAVMYAPVALVQSVGAFQPVFVFLIGIFLTKFIPQIGRESLTHTHLAQKGVAIALVVLGAFLLERN